MKEKLKITELKITSFVTADVHQIKGGLSIIPTDIGCSDIRCSEHDLCNTYDPLCNSNHHFCPA